MVFIDVAKMVQCMGELWMFLAECDEAVIVMGILNTEEHLELLLEGWLGVESITSHQVRPTQHRWPTPGVGTYHCIVGEQVCCCEVMMVAREDIRERECGEVVACTCLVEPDWEGGNG